MEAPENYPELCHSLMKTTTGLDDIVCLANLALHLDKESLENLIKSMVVSRFAEKRFKQQRFFREQAGAQFSLPHFLIC